MSKLPDLKWPEATLAIVIVIALSLLCASGRLGEFIEQVTR